MFPCGAVRTLAVECFRVVQCVLLLLGVSVWCSAYLYCWVLRVVQYVPVLLGVPCGAVPTCTVGCSVWCSAYTCCWVFRVVQCVPVLLSISVCSNVSFYGYCFHVAVQDSTDGRFVCRASPLAGSEAETLNDEINVVVVSELAFLLLLLRPGPEVTQCG